jgi:LemA protein
MHRLEALETEVALIREGFNDAVTQYNERIQSFPDLLLAKLFKFKKMKRLSFTHK